MSKYGAVGSAVRLVIAPQGLHWVHSTHMPTWRFRYCPGPCAVASQAMKLCSLRGNKAQARAADLGGGRDRLDREELDRQLHQGRGPVRDAADELQHVARLQQVAGAAVAVLHAARQHVDQLGGGVLVEREGV